MSAMADTPIPDEAISALERGEIIEAVKLTRERNGSGLKESKDAVDAYIKANPRLKRRLVSERPSGGGNRALAFIGLVLVAAILYLAAGWARAVPPGGATMPAADPPWVGALIKQMQNGPAGNPPLSLWRYTYNGRTVYYLPPQCCDQYSALYDEKHNRICAPDGGMAGNGDGRCADFYQKRTAQKLLWQDKRTR